MWTKPTFDDVHRPLLDSSGSKASPPCRTALSNLSVTSLASSHLFGEKGFDWIGRSLSSQLRLTSRVAPYRLGRLAGSQALSRTLLDGSVPRRARSQTPSQHAQPSCPSHFLCVAWQALRTAERGRSSDPGSQTYHVLLILTDGVIHDMDNTKDAIVEAAKQPFSIIV